MTAPQKILITDGAWAAALPCLQSLGRMGHEIHLLGAHDAAAARSRYCAGHIAAPADVTSVAYAASLIELAAGHHFDWLLPISDDAVAQCSRYRGALDDHVRLLLPPIETVMTAASKRRTYEFAAERGIPIPRTIHVTSLAELADAARQVGYPCVLKLPHGAGRDGVYVIEDRDELTALCRRNPFRGQLPMVQAFVAGPLYTVTGVADAGRTVSMFMCRKPLEYMVGHITAAAYSVTDAALWARARQIVGELGWTGPFGLDFMRSAGGEYLLLEINPRFSGPVNFAYRLGLDLPRDCFRMAFGDRLETSHGPNYRDGALYRSVFPCEFLWYRANRWRPSKLLKHVLRLGAVTNIYWDDPMLTLGQINQTRLAFRAARR